MANMNPWVNQIHNQEAKIYAPLLHKPLGLEEVV